MEKRTIGWDSWLKIAMIFVVIFAYAHAESTQTFFFPAIFTTIILIAIVRGIKEVRKEFERARDAEVKRWVKELEKRESERSSP